MTRLTPQGWLVAVLGLAVLPTLALAGPRRPAVRAQSGAVVFLDPVDQQVQVGQPATMTVRVRDAEDLGAFQFTLTFPQAVTFVSADLGPFLGSTGRSARSFPTLVEPGKATFVAISTGSGPGASGSGVLATVRLTLTEGGAADIGVTGALLTDTTGQRRSEARTEGSRLRSGPSPTATPRPDQMAFLPLIVRAASKADLPVAPSVMPPPASPTRPPATATSTAAPSNTSPPPSPSPSATTSPTPGKPEPIVSELQCYGRHEWVKVSNPSGDPIELEDWSVRSTQGGEVFKVKDALTLNPAEVLTIHSGAGAPRMLDRLNLLWTDTPRWNEVDGDSAELTSPFPSSQVVSTMACATPTPRAP